VAVREHLPNRIRNQKLRRSGGLIPLFEAIANSIHAIDELQVSAEDGRITVTIDRDKSQSDLSALGDATYAPIIGFTITDNGIGFTSKNFESFEIIDSIKKQEIGGKGIGRLSWLSAFDRAAVSSTYRENGRYYHRSFEFEPSIEGVVQHVLAETERPSVLGTTVRLIAFKPEYADRVPRQPAAIGRRIIEHWLTYLSLGTCPRIDLVDSQTNEQIDLRALFKAEVLGASTTTSFEAKGEAFQITHVKINASSKLDHRLHFCAHKRTVRGHALEDLVPNLTKSLSTEDERPFVYYGFVSGDFLDRHVSNDRTAFDFDTEDSELGPSELTGKDLMAASAGEASGFLSPYTAPLAEQKSERVRRYVFERAPRYRHVLKHRSIVLDAIPPAASDDRIDLELYKAQQKYQAELRAEYQRLLAANDTGALEKKEIETEFRKFLQEWNEAGQDALAEHVMLRSATLTYLDSKRDVQESGKYLREDVIHDVICPMQSSSDDLPAESMNLWIIDERLAYHHYLASDLRFDQMPDDIPGDGLDRPDILIFNGPIAFAEDASSYQSLVLVEFKKPARRDYDEDENPFEQIARYVRTIRRGNAVDRKGHPINVKDSTPFYAHIIADLTPNLRTQAESYGMWVLPDGEGFFTYNAPLKIWMEVYSYERMIDGAKKRNSTFFAKLGLRS